MKSEKSPPTTNPAVAPAMRILKGRKELTSAAAMLATGGGAKIARINPTSLRVIGLHGAV
jgi:hypothetical protein